MKEDLNKLRTELLHAAELTEEEFFKNIKLQQKKEALNVLLEFAEEITAEDINKKRP